MAVYFKFKSAKDFDSVSIDGHFISVANLKEKIVEQKKLGRGSDYDLVLSNAQTHEEYTDEGYLVPKNTSVVVRRVPGRPRMPIVADVKEERTPEVLPAKNGLQYVEPSQKNLNISSVSDGLDDFGIDLYAVPEPVQPSTAFLTEDEDSKIKAFVDASASDWQRQTQEGVSAGRGYGNRGQGRGGTVRGYGSGRSFEKKNPPHGYVCHRCGVTGHYIQHCPTNGDPNYDIKKVKPPTGIPKTMLVANPDGSYALPTGEVAVLKPNEAVFEREVDGLPTSSRPLLDIPPELCCPLCKGVLKEAVLTSKCCFKSYCDKCIRQEIISKAKCVCGATNILADDLLPNRTLRDAINRFLESQTSVATSSGNVGSRMVLQDMESAPFVQPKKQSPTLSISLKETSSAVMPSDGGSDTKTPSGVVKSPAQTQAEVSTVSGTVLESTHARNQTTDTLGQGQMIAEASQESLDKKEPPPQELNHNLPGKLEASQRDHVPVHATPAVGQGRPTFEPVKGKKKSKPKRVRQTFDSAYSEGQMWGPGPNYSAQEEMCCQNCGSFDHPTWNCYMNGPGPSHFPPPMQGPMFGPGFGAPMRGMMHQPMPDRFMMPYHHNPGPYNGYGPNPYEMPYNGPMVPQENFVPHVGMMHGGPPMQREYVDTMVMSRDEFEARKAELKRRREREQRFGRDQARYPFMDGEPDVPVLNGMMLPRPERILGRDREFSPEGSEDQAQRIRSHQSVEEGRPSGIKPGYVARRDRSEKSEERHSSDGGEGSTREDSYTERRQERYSSRHVEEGSSGDEVSGGARHPRLSGDMYKVKHNGRKSYTNSNGDRGRESDIYRGGDRAMYDSEDNADLRRLSGLEVGSSSPARQVRRKKTSVDEDLNRDQDGHYKDGARSNRAPQTRDGSRTSVFDRTNLSIKPKRVVEMTQEEDKDDDGERVKRHGHDRRSFSDRRAEVDKMRSPDNVNSRHHPGTGSRKRRRTRDDVIQ